MEAAFKSSEEDQSDAFVRVMKNAGGEGGAIAIMFPHVNAQRCSSPSPPLIPASRGHMLCARNKRQLLKDMKDFMDAVFCL